MAWRHPLAFHLFSLRVRRWNLSAETRRISSTTRQTFQTDASALAASLRPNGSQMMSQHCRKTLRRCLKAPSCDRPAAISTSERPDSGPRGFYLLIALLHHHHPPETRNAPAVMASLCQKRLLENGSRNIHSNNRSAMGEIKKAPS